MFTIERPNADVRAILSKQKYFEVGILGWFGDTMFMSAGTPDFKQKLRRGQLEITKLMKKIDSVDENDIGPVPDSKNRGYAMGVRCPYTKLAVCGKRLLSWDVELSSVLDMIS